MTTEERFERWRWNQLNADPLWTLREDGGGMAKVGFEAGFAEASNEGRNNTKRMVWVIQDEERCIDKIFSTEQGAEDYVVTTLGKQKQFADLYYEPYELEGE